MNSGRELDALVAEKVMGLKHVFNADLTEGWIDIDTVCRSLPSYSTDIAAAWKVVEKLQAYNPFWDADGFMEFDLSPTSGVDGERGWTCNFGDDNTRAYASTAPHAICLAALKAVTV